MCVANATCKLREPYRHETIREGGIELRGGEEGRKEGKRGREGFPFVFRLEGKASRFAKASSKVLIPPRTPAQFSSVLS